MASLHPLEPRPCLAPSCLNLGLGFWGFEFRVLGLGFWGFGFRVLKFGVFGEGTGKGIGKYHRRWRLVWGAEEKMGITNWFRV